MSYIKQTACLSHEPFLEKLIYLIAVYFLIMARLYKNIRVYQLSYDFVLLVYKSIADFPESERSNLQSQIRRASVSIPLNIAEGSAQSSPKQFLHYLNIAFGSAKELEVLFNLCGDLGLLEKDDSSLLLEKLDELTAKLYLFMRDLESKISDKKHKFFGRFEDNKRRGTLR